MALSAWTQSLASAVGKMFAKMPCLHAVDETKAALLGAMEGAAAGACMQGSTELCVQEHVLSGAAELELLHFHESFATIPEVPGTSPESTQQGIITASHAA